MSSIAGSDNSSLCDPSIADLTPAWRALCSGMGITSDLECASYWKGINANSLAAFGPVAANALNADYQLLARSGRQSHKGPQNEPGGGAVGEAGCKCCVVIHAAL